MDGAEVIVSVALEVIVAVVVEVITSVVVEVTVSDSVEGIVDSVDGNTTKEFHVVGGTTVEPNRYKCRFRCN